MTKTDDPMYEFQFYINPVVPGRSVHIFNKIDSFQQLKLKNAIPLNAISAGGIEPAEMKDYGFMQQRNVEDFDGHTWEIFYMDISKYPAEQK